MIFGTDELLLLGAAAFYFYDCLLLLRIDQIGIIHANSWRVAVPSYDFALLGKYPLVCNVFRPCAPIYLFRICNEQDDPQNNSPTELRIPRLLKVTINLLHGLLFIGGLLLTIFFNGGPYLAALIIAVYFLSISIGLLCYSYRDILAISSPTLKSIIIDAFFCPPFAINSVRKVYLSRRMQGDPIRFLAINEKDADIFANNESFKRVFNYQLQSLDESGTYAEYIRKLKSSL